MKKQTLVEKEKISIELPNKMVVLTLEPFDTDVDMDDYTTIHHHNKVGEILTCSTALNRLGNLLADVEALLAEKELNFDIWYSQQEEHFRKALVKEITGMRGGVKIEPATNTEIDHAIKRMKEYKVQMIDIITCKKNKEYIKSFYWAVHGKNARLENISATLRPEEFEKEIVEEKINGVMIKLKEKAIK